MGTHPIFESDFDCLTDRNRTFRCVPNCVTFPASRSIPVTASAPFVMMASRSVSCRQRLVLCIMTRRTHASCAGLSFTVASTRRASPRGFIEATCPTQCQGTKGRRRSLLHGTVGQEAAEARDPPKTTRQCDQGCQGEEEGR